MEDFVLSARLDEEVTLYVSPIDQRTYDEYIGDANLGGGDGYFVIRTTKKRGASTFEVLAKAPSFSAAGDIFDLIVGAKPRRGAINAD